MRGSDDTYGINQLAVQLLPGSASDNEKPGLVRIQPSRLEKIKGTVGDHLPNQSIGGLKP